MQTKVYRCVLALVLAALFVPRLVGCGKPPPPSRPGSGTTSGGFPWQQQGAPSGTTSGGFPWGNPGGGSAAGTQPVAPAPSGSCDGVTITYAAADGATRTFDCTPKRGCTIEVATGSAVCLVVEAGERPFRTCRSAADCPDTTYCAATGDPWVFGLGAAECIDGACDWKETSAASCPPGTLCQLVSCAPAAGDSGVTGPDAAADAVDGDAAD